MSEERPPHYGSYRPEWYLSADMTQFVAPWAEDYSVRWKPREREQMLPWHEGRQPDSGAPIGPMTLWWPYG